MDEGSKTSHHEILDYRSFFYFFLAPPWDLFGLIYTNKKAWICDDIEVEIKGFP